jgi:molybdopterin-containing oxidoreductase family membrane subunit
VLSIFINIGMWFERFVIIVTSLHRDFVPSSWSMYKPTVVEVGTLIGSFGLFFTLFLLFTRVLPMISIGEVKAVLGFGRSNPAHAPAREHQTAGAQAVHAPAAKAEGVS